MTRFLWITALYVLGFALASFNQQATNQSTTDQVLSSADSVVAYAFNISSGANSEVMLDGASSHAIIDLQGALAHNIYLKRSCNAEQQNELLTALLDTSNYTSAHSTCWNPRMGLVYYANAQPIAHASVCLECSQIALSAALGEATYAVDKTMTLGLSPTGMATWSSLCSQLELLACEQYD